MRYRHVKMLKYRRGWHCHVRLNSIQLTLQREALIDRVDNASKLSNQWNKKTGRTNLPLLKTLPVQVWLKADLTSSWISIQLTWSVLSRGGLIERGLTTPEAWPVTTLGTLQKLNLPTDWRSRVASHWQNLVKYKMFSYNEISLNKITKEWSRTTSEEHTSSLVSCHSF